MHTNIFSCSQKKKKSKEKYPMFNTVLLHVNLISLFILLVIRACNFNFFCTNFPECHPPFFSTPEWSLFQIMDDLCEIVGVQNIYCDTKINLFRD